MSYIFIPILGYHGGFFASPENFQRYGVRLLDRILSISLLAHFERAITERFDI